MTSNKLWQNVSAGYFGLGIGAIALFLLAPLTVAELHQDWSDSSYLPLIIVAILIIGMMIIFVIITDTMRGEALKREEEEKADLAENLQPIPPHVAQGL